MRTDRAKVRPLTGVAILALIVAGVLLMACVPMPSSGPTQDRTSVPTALTLPPDAGTPPALTPGQGTAQPAAVPVGYAMTGQVTRTVYLPSALQQTNGSLSCPTITGWQGLYWNNDTLSGAATLCRNDANLAFNWGLGSPDARLPVDHFSVRWTRRLNFTAGRYRFHLAGDDGVRLWIDGNLAIDDWKIQTYTENMADRDLTAGMHDLKVEYFENIGQAAISLTWEQLPSACPNHFAQYYNNTTLSGTPTFTQCEPWVLDHDWGTTGPGQGLGGSNFSVRWMGRPHLPAGTYTFVAETDDGMRVWLNNELIIDGWRDQSVTDYRMTRTLTEGDYDVRVEYYQAASRAVARSFWLLRTLPSGVLVSQRQGFDICQLPPVDQMLTWWNQSPYWEANIYIGGALSACSQPNLTAQNLSTLHTQGWNFIPTWVGPQAPCTNYAARMNADASAAHDQGRSEADAAAAVAKGLGLPVLGGPSGSSIIYYDLEYYSGDDACRATVKSFMDGWVGRLHELGLRAGIYASPCSYMADWATNTNVPDGVWPAAWTDGKYNAGASTTGLACLPDTLWPNHQRIRQYAGGHDEAWGGLTLNIDSNAIDGLVAGDNLRPVSPTVGSETRTAIVPVPGLAATVGREVRGAQLLPAGQGWALAGDKLLWTAGGDGRWIDITPAIAGGKNIRAAYFSDAQHGWLLEPANAAAAGDPGLVVARTADGGKTWATTTLTGLSAAGVNLRQSPANFSFVDARTGWLAFELPTSSNFSRGILLATTDGGQTWRQQTLPIGGAIRFADRNTGWVAGGAGGDQLYMTRDAGRTWQAQKPVSGPAAGEHPLYALPNFRDAQHGILAVTLSGGPHPRIELYRTSDGGRSWQKASTIALATGPVGGPAAAARAALAPNLDILVADPGTGKLWSVAAAGGPAQEVSADPVVQGITDLQVVGEDRAWAQIPSGACTGEKTAIGKNGMAPDPLRCAAQRALLSSSDGGATWQDVSP